jgi:hypothetical protein
VWSWREWPDLKVEGRGRLEKYFARLACADSRPHYGEELAVL